MTRKAFLVKEIAYNKKCAFFTERAAKKALASDKTMVNQLERISTETKAMELELEGLIPKKKRKKKRAKR